MSVDYVSTASGGGLIGATMTSTLQSSGTSPANDEFPLGFTPGRCRASRHEIPPTARTLLGFKRLLAIMRLVLVALTEVAYGLIYEWGEERLRLIPIAIAAPFALETCSSRSLSDSGARESRGSNEAGCP